MAESDTPHDGLRRLTQQTGPLHKIRESRLNSLHLHSDRNIGANCSQLLEERKSTLTRKQPSSSRLGHQIDRTAGLRIAYLEPGEHTSISKFDDRCRLLTKAMMMQRVNDNLGTRRPGQQPRVVTRGRRHPRHVLEGDGHPRSAHLTTEPTQSLLGLGESIQIRDDKQLTRAGPNGELREPRHIRITVGAQPRDLDVVQDNTDRIATSSQLVRRPRGHIPGSHPARGEPTTRRYLCYSGRLGIEHRPCREHQTTRIRHVADDRGDTSRSEQQ